MTKRCRLVCDTPTGIRECELTLADEADIAAAIEAAQKLLGGGRRGLADAQSRVSLAACASAAMFRPMATGSNCTGNC